MVCVVTIICLFWSKASTIFEDFSFIKLLKWLWLWSENRSKVSWYSFIFSKTTKLRVMRLVRKTMETIIAITNAEWKTGSFMFEVCSCKVALKLQVLDTSFAVFTLWFIFVDWGFKKNTISTMLWWVLFFCSKIFFRRFSIFLFCRKWSRSLDIY